MFRKGSLNRFLSRVFRGGATEKTTPAAPKPVPSRTVSDEDFEKQRQHYPASPPTISRYIGSAWAVPKGKHILEGQRKGRLIFKSDRDILENSEYPAEYPSTYVPVEEPEVPDRKGRRALGWLYQNYKELYNRHRNHVWFNYIDPRKQQCAGVWVAPTATVIGNVFLGDFVSVWYGAVLRADRNEISVGGFTNIQDGVIITTDDRPNPGGFNSEVSIGSYVTIGHGARLHACKIGNECTIGMNSTILEGAIIEDHVIIAGGSVIPPGAKIPEGEVWGGVPARFIRKVGKFEKVNFNQQAEDYYQLSVNHSLEFTNTGLAYKEVDAMVEQLEEQAVQNESEEPVEWNVWEKMGQGQAVPIFPDQTHNEDFQKHLQGKQHEHEKKFW